MPIPSSGPRSRSWATAADSAPLAEEPLWAGPLPRRLDGVLLAFALAVSDGCSTAAVMPPSGQPVAEAPSYRVGDEWRRTTGEVRRVIALEAGLTVATRSSGCSGCRYYVDGNLTLVKVLDRNGVAVNDVLIGNKTFAFPLFVGKRWESEHRLPAGSLLLLFKSTFVVEAYETVRTKAGTFEVFRILHVLEQQPSLDFVGQGSSRELLWYSPSAKAAVKRQVTMSPFPGSWGRDWELESYSLLVHGWSSRTRCQGRMRRSRIELGW